MWAARLPLPHRTENRRRAAVPERTDAPFPPKTFLWGYGGRRRVARKSVTNSIAECLLIYLTMLNFALIMGA